MKIRPLGDRVLVKRIKEEDTSCLLEDGISVGRQVPMVIASVEQLVQAALAPSDVPNWSGSNANRPPPVSAMPRPAMRAGNRFIGGEPIKVATNILAGRL